MLDKRTNDNDRTAESTATREQSSLSSRVLNDILTQNKSFFAGMDEKAKSSLSDNAATTPWAKKANVNEQAHLPWLDIYDGTAGQSRSETPTERTRRPENTAKAARPGLLTAESLAQGQEQTALAWKTRGYGSEAITAQLVKQDFRARGQEHSNDSLSKHSDDSRQRRLFTEFGRHSNNFIDTFKKDSRFEVVQKDNFKESDLKRGDIIVWPKDQRNPYGLSKVYLGNGKAASDSITNLQDDLHRMGNSKPYVFRLKETSPEDTRRVPDKDTEKEIQPQPTPEPNEKQKQSQSTPESAEQQKHPNPSDKNILPSERMSKDYFSPDYYRFKGKDDKVIDLREIARSGFPQEWNHYDNAPGSGLNAVKETITDVARGKGKWNAEMQNRYEQLKNDPRMHYCFMVDGKVASESIDATQPQEGASTTKAIIFASRHVLADKQGKDLTPAQYKEEMATLAYSLNQLVRPVQKECASDTHTDPTGMKSIMQTMNTLGISEASQPTWGPNKLAPRDGAAFMQKVMTNNFPGAEQLKTMMEMCKYGDDKMVMTAPEGVPVAHKTGTYNGNNDLGGCIIRGEDGKDHVVTFNAQTRLSTRDIGILFGGLLHENGLTKAPSSCESEKSQALAGNVPLSAQDRNNLLQSIASDRNLCQKVADKDGHISRPALEPALERKNSLNARQQKDLTELRNSFNILARDGSVELPVKKDSNKEPSDNSSQHISDRDARARESAQIVAKVAGELGVDPSTAVAAMLVESGGNPRAVGDGGTSFGLFQLHKGGELDDNIYHRSLTREEAFDPELNARVALSVFKQNQDRYSNPGVLSARSQRPADQEGYASMVNGNLPSARKLLAQAATQGQVEENKNSAENKPESKQDTKPDTKPDKSDNQPERRISINDTDQSDQDKITPVLPVPADKSALNPRLQKYYEQLGTMAKVDENHPFDMNRLVKTCSYDEQFLQGKAKFQKMQSEGKAPSLQQLFQQAKEAAPAGQRYFEASVPYGVSNDKREAVGQNFMWDEKGNLVSENYWRRGGGDQLGQGKTVTVYHNIEGINAAGTDIGWINQSTNESFIARGGNPPVDMHGRSLSSGTSAGCEAHPSDSKYQNWQNFRDKMHLAILDNQARGLRPFASLHVGFEYTRQ